MNSPQNRRILVVDDNPAIHADFKKILCPAADNRAELEASEAEIFGDTKGSKAMDLFQVDSAFQGEEGLQLVQKSVAAGQPYAMVFMDVRMPPGWDGIETTAKIWELDPDLQIVICTAYSDYSWDAMIAKLGISDRLVILKKPFDNVEVIQLAHALTEKWGLLQKSRTKMEQLETLVAQRTRELQATNEQLKVEIAQHAETEEALRQSQKMKALGQLAGGIAHDFNNLLTVIRGYVECLSLEEQQSPDTIEALQEIQRATDRAAQLTSQMLMFSRKKRMQPQDLDLAEVITRLGNMLSRILGENIALQVQCARTPLSIHADPVMIELIIMNLAVNARDAMLQGGRLLVQTEAVEFNETNLTSHSKGRTGWFACITVSDTGSGIAPESMPHLFEPFFTTKEIGKGTGLGLATVYGIVQQHDGWIEVESESGRGATFKIFLPINAEKLKLEPESRPKPRSAGGSETILLVEDEPAVRRLAQNILERHGYRVLEAASGVKALAVWDMYAAEINLLLTDMVMPDGISGRELAKMVLAQKPGLKVIYATGYSLDALNPDFPMEEGLNFLAKPYALDKLISTVRRCLDEPPIASQPTESPVLLTA